MQSKPDADWSEIKNKVVLKNKKQSEFLFVGYEEFMFYQRIYISYLFTRGNGSGMFVNSGGVKWSSWAVMDVKNPSCTHAFIPSCCGNIVISIKAI